METYDMALLASKTTPSSLCGPSGSVDTSSEIYPDELSSWVSDIDLEAQVNGNIASEAPTSCRHDPTLVTIRPGRSKRQHLQYRYPMDANRYRNHIQVEPTVSLSVKSRHFVLHTQQSVISFMREYYTRLRIVIYTVLTVGFLIYTGFAIKYSLDGAMALIVITSLIVIFIIYEQIKKYWGKRIYKGMFVPAGNFWNQHWHIIKWFLYSSMVISLLLYLVFNVIQTFRQLQSLTGIVVFILIPLATSKYPKYINWRTVIWGMALQFVIGCLVLRWEHGYNAIKFVATELNKFLSYSLDGGAVVFGNPTFVLHPFAMIVVPLVVFLGCAVSILYYWGVIQWVAIKLGWLMSISLQTTAIESISLVVNIFLSVVDVVLMMKDYLPMLTESELHCFLVAAHSTIAGFAFGIFVLFGINGQHLLTGAVMSAPAAVAFSKLNWPEIHETYYKTDKDLQLRGGNDVNVIDAAVRGSWAAGVSAGTILIQTIAFMGLIIFVDTGVTWIFSRVGIYMDLATFVGYLFMPFAFLMGVDWEDTLTVGRLIGLKVTANEFIAYFDLGRMIRNNMISNRSAAIATYAMCGFSSFGTLVIFSGVWAAVDPGRVDQVLGQIPRLMMNSNLSCFMTACIASLLYTDDVLLDENESVGILGDMASWFLGYIDGLEERRQRLLEIYHTTEI